MGIITFDPISAIGKNEDWMIEAASRFITEIPEQRKLNYDYALYGLLALAACKERIATDTPVSRALKGKWLEALMPLLCNHGLGGPPEEVSNERFAALFPQEFVEAFERFVKVRYAEGAPLDELSSLSEIPLQGLSGALEQTISNEPFNSGGFFNSVNFLANTNAEAAIRVLSKKITQLFPADSGDESVVILAAAMVLSRGLLDSDIEAYFKESELFTKALLYGASKLRRHDRELDFSKWPDNALKHLGEACWRSFHVPDRHRDRGSFKFSAVTAEDEAMEFRDAISSAAWKRGIDLDIPAFVEGENPEESLQRQHMIDWHRHTNRQIRVSYEWKPISLPQFLKLMEKPNARLARNQDELMEAIIQSLQRWEETLVNGKWHVLWNFQKIKHEKVIAREMADWLQRDLELQVDCETEPILDKRADLLVKIQPTDGISQCLQVVIEVKKLRAGNSRERKTAMKSQLLKNYLEPRLADGWTHGLFIVAWTPDPGSASDSIESLQLQSIELKKQAEELSVDPFTLKSLVLDCRYRGKIVKANEA